MATISFRHINKVYDNKVQAVFDFNLEVKDKEFIVLVGPSGCGKSTTLRMLAGLEEITSGQIYIDDRLINAVEPKNRDIAMVFQNYALYPHMTVYKNIAFGLQLRRKTEIVLDENGEKVLIPDPEAINEINKQIRQIKKTQGKDADVSELEAKITELNEHPTVVKTRLVSYSKEEIDQRVTETAKILGLTPYLNRKPGELSGGQRQRVALGRAIVRSPKVFLMDEPLSNLDAKLRVSMRSEIAKIHERVGATTVYVTHDQTEAMTMASRIVIMKDGYIQQIGTPEEVYNLPNNIFVGSFIGSPSMNFYNVKLVGNKVIFVNEDGSEPESFTISASEKKRILSYYDAELAEVNDDVAKLSALIEVEEDKKVHKVMEEELQKLLTKQEYYNSLNKDELPLKLGIRPEDIHLSGSGKERNLTNEFELTPDVVELLGNEFIVYSYLGDQRVVAKVDIIHKIKAHEVKKFAFDLDKIHFFDKETTDRIK